MSADDEHAAPYSLFPLLKHAAAFSDVLSQHNEQQQPSEDVVSVLGRDLVSLSLQRPRASPSIFGSLDRLVRLHASSWLSCPFGKSHTGLAGDSSSDSDHELEEGAAVDLVSEPLPFTTTPPPILPSDVPSGEPSPAPSPKEASPEPSFVTSPAASSPSPSPTISPMVSQVWSEHVAPLTAEEKMSLIIDEFGALAHDGEEERLLVDADASFFRDVVILGVLHLTTHRLTFHASLQHARPDLVQPRQVLHSGSALVPSKTLRGRKRVWLELTCDMITSFRSSDDHARVRPLRTILLSAFRKIHPVDTERPRMIKIEYMTVLPAHSKSPRLHLRHHRHNSKKEKSEETGSEEEVRVDDVEFDTEEAALGWRNAVQSALYRFGSHRRRVLNQQRMDEDDGVRINVPLSTIKCHTVENWTNFGTLLQVDLEGCGGCQDPKFLQRSASLHSDLSGSSVASGVIETPFGAGWTPPQSKQPTSLHFALLRSDPAWDRLETLIKAAQSTKSPARVTVDFGAFTFVERGLEAVPAARDISSSREREVRRVFGLSPQLDIWITKASLVRTLLSTSGLLVVSTRFVCFWSRLVAAADVKLRFPTPDVRVIAPSTGVSLILRVRGQQDLTLEFHSTDSRDEAARRLAVVTARQRPRPKSLPTSISLPDPPPSPPMTATELLSPSSRALSQLRTRTFPVPLLPHIVTPINVPASIPFGVAPSHFVCLTIGSRGDVQPYIALGRGLKNAGHRVTIVTHEEYKAWIEGWGIEHRTAGGDPGRLMKLSVEHKMFSPQFFKESLTNFRSWIDELLVEAWEQCQDADVLIESPSAMAGVHIAEALKIPYFRAFTMPWSKTAQYPHAFISPPVEGSASFNVASYVLFDNVFWLGTSGQINKWRKKHLDLPPTDMGHMAQAKIPFLYNFSTSVVPKPLDWGDHINITGYWFLDNPDTDWTPPPELIAFIDKARAENKPLVYIGFGSITVPNSRAMTRSIIKAVLKSGVRAILSKGWSDRMDKDDGPELELPPEIYCLEKVPHDWLFPQIDAALHHGGAGTTGASLRAGIPTLIKPWFGDQFFWASRVHRLGAGLRVASLRSADLAEALRKATSDRTMQEKAAQVGEKIAQEDGVSTAIKALYTYMHRARLRRTTNDK